MGKVVGKVVKIVGIAALAYVTAGVALGVAAGASVGTAFAFAAGGLGVSGALLGGAALAGASTLLSKKPKISPAQVDRLTVGGIVTDTPRKIVFGRTAVALDLRYQEQWGAENEYVSQVIATASHWIGGITRIWIANELAWTREGGVQGRFVGYFFVSDRAKATAANTYVDNWSGRWGATARLVGCSDIDLRYRLLGLDKKAEGPFSSGLPSRMTVEGEAALFYDPRFDTTVGGSGPMRVADQTTWAFTIGGHEIGRNPALALLFYLLGWRINGQVAVGCGVPVDRIDLDSFMTAANICDETVTRPNGSTEPRYRCDGVFSDADDPKSVRNSLEATMNGRLRDRRGKLALQIFHNDLGTPVLDLTESDLVGEDYTWATGPDLTERKNIVRGRYTDPSANALYQLVDYPPVKIASLDGIDRIDPIDFPLVQSAGQAQRLAKQQLQRSLFGGTFTASFNAKGWAVEDGAIVRLRFGPLGFDYKMFRVELSTVDTTGVVPMMLREEDPSIYAAYDNEQAAIVAATPQVYNPLSAPLVRAIGDAGETATWAEIGGAGKPADNATNSADPNSPFGAGKTVGQARQDIKNAGDAASSAAGAAANALAAAGAAASQAATNLQSTVDNTLNPAIAAAKKAGTDAAQLVADNAKVIVDAVSGQGEQASNYTEAVTALTTKSLTAAGKLTTILAHWNGNASSFAQTIGTIADDYSTSSFSLQTAKSRFGGFSGDLVRQLGTYATSDHSISFDIGELKASVGDDTHGLTAAVKIVQAAYVDQDKAIATLSSTVSTITAAVVNKVKNPTFKQGSTGWQDFFGACSFESQFEWMVVRGLSGTYTGGIRSDPFYVEGGKPYTMSGELAAGLMSSGGVHMDLEWCDYAGAPLGSFSGRASNYNHYSNFTFVATTVYAPAAAGYARLRVFLDNTTLDQPGSSQDVVWGCRRLQVEQSTSVHTWVDYADVSAYVASVGQLATTVNDLKNNRLSAFWGIRTLAGAAQASISAFAEDSNGAIISNIAVEAALFSIKTPNRTVPVLAVSGDAVVIDTDLVVTRSIVTGAVARTVTWSTFVDLHGDGHGNTLGSEHTLASGTFDAGAGGDLLVSASGSHQYAGFGGNDHWELRFYLDGQMRFSVGGAGFGTDAPVMIRTLPNIAGGSHSYRFAWLGDANQTLAAGAGGALQVLQT